MPMPQVVKGTLETVENTSKRISERTHVVDVTVPQIMEKLEERIPERMYERVVDAPVPMAVHQPGNQASRDPAEPVHRQSCRPVCGDTVTGPSSSDFVEDSGNLDQPSDKACRVPTDSLHRQGCCRYACGNAVKGPSDSNCVEVSGKPVGAVRPQSYCDQADGPGDQACLAQAISVRTQC